MNRPHRLSLLAVVAALIAAFVLSACGGGGSEKSGESAQAVLEEATLQGIESGEVDLSLDLSAPGSEGGHLEVSLSGPFQSEGKNRLPQLSMAATAQGHYNGKDIDFDGGLTLLHNTAYIRYEGTDYKVDPSTYNFLEQMLKRQQREAGVEAGTAGVAGCQEELGRLKVAEFLEDGKNEGSEDVGGTSTAKISGELNTSVAIDSLLEVLESQACRSQLAAAGPLPSKSEVEKAEDEVSSSVKKPQVSVYVGDDDIVRRISAELTVEPQNGRKGPKSVAVDFDLQLSGVNEEQEISAPEKTKSLGQLFEKLGINPLELLGVLQGETNTAELGKILLEGAVANSGK
jgi:hypothetical protein